MLTEDWDAKTVTQIFGFRAFNSQLLCEQVTRNRSCAAPPPRPCGTSKPRGLADVPSSPRCSARPNVGCATPTSTGPTIKLHRSPNLRTIAMRRSTSLLPFATPTRADRRDAVLHRRKDPSVHFVAQLQSLEPAPTFGDPNSLPKYAAYEWFQHEGNWSNRLIPGDSQRSRPPCLPKRAWRARFR